MLSVNDRLSPFIGAGFYYKTFMWPRRAWERLYEPAIRRAAGLGALSGAPSEDGAEKALRVLRRAGDRWRVRRG